jgi:hypothetical protein
LPRPKPLFTGTIVPNLKLVNFGFSERIALQYIKKQKTYEKNEFAE